MIGTAGSEAQGVVDANLVICDASLSSCQRDDGSMNADVGGDHVGRLDGAQAIMDNKCCSSVDVGEGREKSV